MLSLGSLIPLKNFNFQQKNESVTLMNPRRNNSISRCLKSSNVNRVSGYEEKRENIVTMPKHVAVCFDGNRRWAAERGLSPMDGHVAGWKAMRKIIKLCHELGVQALTIFCFSTRNWTRTKEEIDHLMGMYEDVLNSDLDEQMRNGIRQTVIGNKSRLPKSLQETISRIEKTTRNNSKFELTYAIGYGGRFDILQACKSIASKVKNGVILPIEIDEDLVENELLTKHIHPSSADIHIRPGGDLRFSDFLLWQVANSELYFIDKQFPDFEESDLLDAFSTFSEKSNM